MNFEIDHKNFNFDVNFSQSVKHLKDKTYVICNTDLNSLYAKIATGFSASNKIKYKLVKLENTQHFKFISGNKKPYTEYLLKYGHHVGFGIEHSVENFEDLLSKNPSYLKGIHSSDYIICERVKTFYGVRNVILDGVHRGASLLKNNCKRVPVAFILDDRPNKLLQLDQYLNDYRDDFLEWYTPIEINGRIIHERTYPEFKERPEFLSNKERGKSKWEFIIKNNLPNLKGKTICDVGCNVGLFSIYMSQLGAKKVDGYDRSANTIQPTNEQLPRQSVVQQAYFVKNLFTLDGINNLDNIEYIECDISTLDFSKFKYDIFFSSCVLYHFGKKFEEIIKNISSNVPEVFLQTNIGHKSGELARLASISYHRDLLEKYGYEVKVDAPNNYNYPVIYAKKTTSQ